MAFTRVSDTDTIRDRLHMLFIFYVEDEEHTREVCVDGRVHMQIVESTNSWQY